MKKFLILGLLMLGSVMGLYAQDNTIYQFKVKAIDGSDFDFASLKGKKIIVVNTASKCGLTPQYADLEKLYKDFQAEGLVIIGFPANNFMKQEPGTNAEILEFCQSNYGVTFPMMEKISVKGDDMAPIYKWLTSKKLNGVKDSDVSWNFQKYLINSDGTLYDVLSPRDKVDSDKVMLWLN